jgi:hypothetical protein
MREISHVRAAVPCSSVPAVLALLPSALNVPSGWIETALLSLTTLDRLADGSQFAENTITRFVRVAHPG